MGSRDYYASTPSRPSRFSRFAPVRHRTPLLVLYAAGDLDGAISETVFHDVPVRGDTRVPGEHLLHRLAVDRKPVRDIRLVGLRSDGLHRLDLTRAELVEGGPRSYLQTARRARALHASPAAPDGLLWVSRQRDTSLAVVLFGDRVRREELRPVSGAAPCPWAFSPGYGRVAAIADAAGNTLPEPS